jgi:tetratricopeptide (TPR) repeat protein
MKTILSSILILVLMSWHLVAQSDGEECYDKGHAFYKVKQYDSAVYYWEKANNIMPHWSVYMNLGLVYGKELGDHERALALAKEGISILPKDVSKKEHIACLLNYYTGPSGNIMGINPAFHMKII